MTIIPAIDILDGQCVRLYKGSYDQSTVYSGDPVETAEEFVRQGAERIHIVDLNAARGGSAGGADNREVIGRIRKAVPAVIEVGGGIRSRKDVEELLALGVHRLILGTLLVREPQTAEAWIREYGGVFIAGIDALDGKVRISGWEEGSELEDRLLARQAAAMGFVSIIYTNIDRDGALEGPDLDATAAIAREAGLPVILSGGISGLEDIRRASSSPEAAGGLIPGLITGKALYEKNFTLSDAIQLARRTVFPQGEAELKKSYKDEVLW